MTSRKGVDAGGWRGAPGEGFTVKEVKETRTGLSQRTREEITVEKEVVGSSRCYSKLETHTVKVTTKCGHREITDKQDEG